LVHRPKACRGRSVVLKKKLRLVQRLSFLDLHLFVRRPKACVRRSVVLNKKRRVQRLRFLHQHLHPLQQI
jgi:hypothetical protein